MATASLLLAGLAVLDLARTGALGAGGETGFLVVLGALPVAALAVAAWLRGSFP